jgi:hypothetical protein
MPMPEKSRCANEAYLLSKLQSLSAIRGQAVDDALSERLVPALQRKLLPSAEDIRRRARQLFEERLSCAKLHPLAERLAAPGKLPAVCTPLRQ